MAVRWRSEQQQRCRRVSRRSVSSTTAATAPPRQSSLTSLKISSGGGASSFVAPSAVRTAWSVQAGLHQRACAPWGPLRLGGGRAAFEYLRFDSSRAGHVVRTPQPHEDLFGVFHLEFSKPPHSSSLSPVHSKWCAAWPAPALGRYLNAPPLLGSPGLLTRAAGAGRKAAGRLRTQPYSLLDVRSAELLRDTASPCHGQGTSNLCTISQPSH